MSQSDNAAGFDQFRQVFFDECAERLDETREMLGDFQNGATDKETLNAIFRGVHSIKAGAGAFGFNRLVTFAHIFENVLDLLRDDIIPPTAEVGETLIASTDILTDLIAAAQAGSELDPGVEEAASASLSALIADATGGAAAASGDTPAQDGTGETASGPRTVTITFVPDKDLFRHANEPLLMIRELQTLGNLSTKIDVSNIPDTDSLDPETCYLRWIFELETESARDDIEGVFEFVLDECELTITEPVPEAVAAPDVQSDGASAAGLAPASVDEHKQEQKAAQMRVSSIRVDLDRIDRLVNMVGELVIAQSMVLENLSRNAEINLASELTGIDDLKQRTRELQEGVMAIRMQPVKSIFMRMPRIVRETAPKLNKLADLVTEGEHTEVDKTIIEELSEPLTHMIRNAIDHGLEPPEDRAASGKPERGTIRLTAEHRGGRILISVSDDGRGLNLEKIRASAVKKGLIEEGAELTDNEIRQLILMPGFSTADQISDVSGRGVGMDVVQRKVQSLGGRISVESQQGKGTHFALALPLTLAVLDGMLITVGPERYIVPLTSIVETIKPEREQIRKMHTGQEILSIRGEFVPLVYLSAAFHINGGVRSARDGLVILVETETGTRVGLVVDELLGQQQVVIKNLEENYRSVRGVAGATILGNGRVALILDIDTLSALTENITEHLSETDFEDVDGEIDVAGGSPNLSLTTDPEGYHGNSTDHASTGC